VPPPNNSHRYDSDGISRVAPTPPARAASPTSTMAAAANRAHPTSASCVPGMHARSGNGRGLRPSCRAVEPRICHERRVPSMPHSDGVSERPPPASVSADVASDAPHPALTRRSFSEGTDGPESTTRCAMHPAPREHATRIRFAPCAAACPSDSVGMPELAERVAVCSGLTAGGGGSVTAPRESVPTIGQRERRGWWPRLVIQVPPLHTQERTQLQRGTYERTSPAICAFSSMAALHPGSEEPFVSVPCTCGHHDAAVATVGGRCRPFELFFARHQGVRPIRR
jgi:hypothetical protein